MLEGTSLRFDHGIRELQLREGQQPAQDTLGVLVGKLEPRVYAASR